MMLNKLNILTLAVFAFFGSHAAFADQLVTNGGFETGDFTGLTVTGSVTGASNPSLYYGVDTMDAASGTYGAYLSTLVGDATPLTLSQTLTVQPSHIYELSFDLAQNSAVLPGFVNSFSVTLNGQGLFSENDIPVIGFTPFSYEFETASNAPASEVLAISSRNELGYFSLDNVSLSTTTPEPATFVLGIPAIGLLALRRRRPA